MDYKYIEQLLERYWQCETSLAEEEVLRVFFSQDEIPLHLIRFKEVFQYENQQKQITLSDDFEQKVMEKIAIKQVKAKPISLFVRLRPLFTAAAGVAIVLTLGNAIQHTLQNKQIETDYNYESYQDTYNDPNIAYDYVSTALRKVSEGISQLQPDTIDMQVKGAELND